MLMDKHRVKNLFKKTKFYKYAYRALTLISICFVHCLLKKHRATTKR